MEDNEIYTEPDENNELFGMEGEPDESMDGDHESALASAGFGTDEDYGGGTHEWENETPLGQEYEGD